MTAVLALICGFAGLSAIAPSAGAAPGGSPHGAFDGYSVSFTPPDHMSGWAADPSIPGRAIEVRVYLDGRFYGSTHTGQSRPDVGSAVPWAGATSGWRLAMDPTGAGLGPPGPHTFCAYAINVGPGANVSLGCRPQPSNAPNPANPIGRVEQVHVTPGLIRVVGWAGDRNGMPTTRLQVLLDGGESAKVVASLPRPDVAAALGLSSTTGFDATIPVIPGTHSFMVIAENTGMGEHNPIIWEHSYAIPGVQTPGLHDPRGSFDGMSRDEVGSSDDYERSAWGWAYDPDTAGPVTVLFRMVGYGAIDRPDTGVYLRRLATGLSLPDLPLDEPGAGPNAGFDGHLVTTHYDGVRYACAYVVNIGEGRTRFIGCRSDLTLRD